MMNDPYAIYDGPKRQPDEIEIPPNGNSLDLLQAIYRCSPLPLTTRMRAALGAIQHEVPKLLATAIIQENDLATLLDRRIARYQEMEHQVDRTQRQRQR